MATSSFDKEFIVTDEEAIRGFLADIYGEDSESYKESIVDSYGINTPLEEVGDETN